MTPERGDTPPAPPCTSCTEPPARTTGMYRTADGPPQIGQVRARLRTFSPKHRSGTLPHKGGDMAAKTTGKTAARKATGRAKKGGSMKPAPKRADAQPAADTSLQQLEQKVRQAEARAQQLERDAREVQGRAQQLERELQAAQAALRARSDQLADKARLLDGAEAALRATREQARTLEARIAAQERSKPGAGSGSAVPTVVEGVKKLRCPRCSGAMTEYQHQVVRADRCDSCHGIFFDNGELEQAGEVLLVRRAGRQLGHARLGQRAADESGNV